MSTLDMSEITLNGHETLLKKKCEEKHRTINGKKDYELLFSNRGDDLNFDFIYSSVPLSCVAHGLAHVLVLCLGTDAL